MKLVFLQLWRYSATCDVMHEELFANYTEIFDDDDDEYMQDGEHKGRSRCWMEGWMQEKFAQASPQQQHASSFQVRLSIPIAMEWRLLCVKFAAILFLHFLGVTETRVRPVAAFPASQVQPCEAHYYAMKSGAKGPPTTRALARPLCLRITHPHDHGHAVNCKVLRSLCKRWPVLSRGLRA